MTSKRQPPDGYPSLGRFMASDPDRTAIIYRRFDHLTARHLLYLQCELAELEKCLDGYDEQDRGLSSARNWEDFKKKEREQPERMLLLDKIGKTILEYKSLLAHEAVLAPLNPPDPKILKAFRFNFFHGDPQSPNSFPVLGGASMTMYDDGKDLLVFKSSEQQDRLSKLAQGYLGCFFPNDVSDDTTVPSRVSYASGRHIDRFISFLSTILAALLLIGAIVVLYKVKSPDVKLGLIGVFTVLFAASVGLLTNARRAEVFAATAAYAAVLVVFVSGDFGTESK